VETADEVHQLREEEIRNSVQLATSLNRKLERLDLIEKDLQLSNRTLELLKQEQLVDKKSLKAQQVLTYSLTSALLIMFVASLFIYRSGNQKRKANLTLALRSLRSQMNPHFIYNSLNSVNNHISKKDEKAANKYLSDFSRLMRAVMENSKHDFVPLSSEMEILKLYLFLEHSRFSDKFDYTIEVEEEIDADACSIPPMLVQPFVENAIWHGLRYRESKGQLGLSFRKSNGCVVIAITDNGIGRKKSEELKTKNQKGHNSTGLLNIRNRIELINQLFDIKLELTIEDLDHESQTGTRVEIMVPRIKGGE
jgi:two-component system, LytTR family, sensor kinase